MEITSKGSKIILQFKCPVCDTEFEDDCKNCYNVNYYSDGQYVKIHGQQECPICGHNCQAANHKKI